MRLADGSPKLHPHSCLSVEPKVDFFSTWRAVWRGNMKRAELRVLLRWGLAILLSAVSLFFLITGFSTALLGDGAEPGELRRAWSLHAAFQLSIGMLFWLGSVVIFMSLRPGGFWKAVRGQQINSVKRWFYIASLITALAGFLLSNPVVFVTKLQIHRCLKNGGEWVYLTNSCKFEKSP